MQKQVNVLMSTYNGEKYLREQIDSVLAQEGVDVRLEIRDDGSKDSTISIIEEYVAKDSRVKFHKGRNVGVIKSFFMLLEDAEPSEYYAFCDQDDYWEKDKLTSAVGQLEDLHTSGPALYCSNLNVVDEKLNFCRLSKTKPISTQNKYNALVDFYAVGCTEVFNDSAAQLVKKHLAEDTLMHDSWMFLMCSFFGSVVYDITPHIKYRQHGHNVIGSKKNKWEQIKDSFNRICDRSVQPRLQSANALLKMCENELSEQDLAKVRKVTNYKKNLLSRLCLLFDFDICSGSFLSDVKYRLLIILGTI